MFLKKNNDLINNYKCLTYNTCWEYLDPIENPKYNNLCKKNIYLFLKNFDNFLKENQKLLDFCFFQEAKFILQCFQHKKILKHMSFEYHTSGKEIIVLSYSKTFGKPDKIFKGEMQKGRPYLALYFKNKNLIITNVHFGHYYSKNWKIHFENIFLNIVKNMQIKNIEDIRWIIGGDFNYTVQNLLNDKKKLSLKHLPISFHLWKKKIKTCCSPLLSFNNNEKYYTNFCDQILDSKYNIQNCQILPISPYSSDHKPMYFQLK